MIKASLKNAVIALYALPSLALMPVAATAQTIDVNSNTTYQVVRGFGGHNGVGWIPDLTADQVETAFGTGPGQVGLPGRMARLDVRGRWAFAQIRCLHGEVDRSDGDLERAAGNTASEAIQHQPMQERG